jgi:hypothetical protein
MQASGCFYARGVLFDLFFCARGCVFVYHLIRFFDLLISPNVARTSPNSALPRF